jgi:hypothetical protein
MYFFGRLISFLLFDQLRLEKVKAGRKGNLNIATEVIVKKMLN